MNEHPASESPSAAAPLMWDEGERSLSRKIGYWLWILTYLTATQFVLMTILLLLIVVGDERLVRLHPDVLVRGGIALVLLTALAILWRRASMAFRRLGDGNEAAPEFRRGFWLLKWGIYGTILLGFFFQLNDS